MVASVGVVSIRGLSEHGDGLARTVYDLDTVARRTTQASFTPTLHPSEIAKPSTSFGWGKGRNVTSVGWQVTLGLISAFNLSSVSPSSFSRAGKSRFCVLRFF